jgi:hypothetical protein
VRGRKRAQRTAVPAPPWRGACARAGCLAARRWRRLTAPEAAAQAEAEAGTAAAPEAGAEAELPGAPQPEEAPPPAAEPLGSGGPASEAGSGGAPSAAGVEAEGGEARQQDGDSDGGDETIT